jgi:hypothetical protein
MNAPASAGARRRRYGTAAATVMVGAALLGAAALLANSWRGQLPDPVASHWGTNGPNGYSTLDALIGLLLVTGLVLVLGFGAITLTLGHTAATRRIGAAGTIWSALFLSIITAGSLFGQRGIQDARDAPGIGGVLLVAFIGSFVSAVLAAVVVPGDPPQPTATPVDSTAPRAVLVEGEGTVWSGAADSRGALVVGLVAVALIVMLAVVTDLWALIAVAIAVFALIATMSVVTVRVDQAGLTVSAPTRWPRIRVPLNELVRADTVEVRPMRDFGGWGWRVGRGGRLGIVLRGGEALLVERTGGRSIVVTVDGAGVAAGTLNALADRARRA